MKLENLLRGIFEASLSTYRASLRERRLFDANKSKCPCEKDTLNLFESRHVGLTKLPNRESL